MSEWREVVPNVHIMTTSEWVRMTANNTTK